jgi:hypothetical protein
MASDRTKRASRYLFYLLAGTLLVYLTIVVKDASNQKAVERSKKICTAVRPGMTQEELRKVAASQYEELRQFDSEEVGTQTVGLTLSCRCRVQMKNDVSVNAPTQTCWYP